MKNFKVMFVLLSMLLSSIPLYSSGSSCGTTSSVMTNSIPLTGTIRAYFVFVQFRDDSQASTEWPLNTYPTWANNFVNATAGGTYPYPNISHYYNEMSNGTFQVIGDVYDNLVITDLNQSQYTSIGQVNREVLSRIDPEVNFALYDILNGSSWGTDGIVDMVCMVYRNVTGTSLMDYTGIANLSMSSTYNTNDGVSIINHNLWEVGGGVQMRGGWNGRDYSTYIAAHELGHYLFGGGHINFISNLGLMTGLPYWNDDRGMCAWERRHLGWITTQDVSTNTSVTMTDYMTTRNVVRIPLSANEYFLIENRRHLSSHDGAKDNGFYIYHVTSNSWVPTIDVECADGNWNFTVNTSTQTVTRTTQNYASNNDEMNFYQYSGGIEYRCIQPYYPQDDAGGDIEDAFDLAFNNVFSPSSNPRSTNGLATNFSVEVTGENTLTFYFTNPYSGSPSKPQNPRVSSNPGNGLIRFSWDANSESDLVNYEVSRKVQEWGGTWEVVTNTTNTFFVDPDYYYTDPYGDFHCTYRVRAKDSQNLFSIYSDEVTARAEYMHKKSVNTNPLISYNTQIDQNYPNPFNPSTIINYTLKEKEHVLLVVYDILGKEVARLVNGIQTEGEHSVSFDGSNLPSGIYVYRLIGTNFNISKKMLLIK